MLGQVLADALAQLSSIFFSHKWVFATLAVIAAALTISWIIG